MFCFIFLLLSLGNVAFGQESCPEPRVRKPWTGLSEEEKQDFINAVLLLNKAPKNGGDSIYHDFVEMHAKSFSYAHGDSTFLPWHRWYLYLFETKLREVTHSCITVPYWDWETTSGRDWEHSVFSEKSISFGPARASNNKNRCPVGGPFTKDSWKVWKGGCVQREFNERTTSVSEAEIVSLIMKFRTYEKGFRPYFEGGPHAGPHLYVAGAMETGVSPNDPLFFLHHANMDRIWAIWQDCWDHDKAKLSPNMPTAGFDASRSGHGLVDTMEYNGDFGFFVEGWFGEKLSLPTPLKVLHIDQPYLNYRYVGENGQRDALVEKLIEFDGCKKGNTWDWFPGQSPAPETPAPETPESVTTPTPLPNPGPIPVTPLPSRPFCGDGICNGNENCRRCSRDCDGNRRGRRKNRFCCTPTKCRGRACRRNPLLCMEDGDSDQDDIPSHHVDIDWSTSSAKKAWKTIDSDEEMHDIPKLNRLAHVLCEGQEHVHVSDAWIEMMQMEDEVEAGAFDTPCSPHPRSLVGHNDEEVEEDDELDDDELEDDKLEDDELEDEDDENSGDDKLEGWAIGIIVLASVAFALLLAVLIGLLVKK